MLIEKTAGGFTSNLTRIRKRCAQAVSGRLAVLLVPFFVVFQAATAWADRVPALSLVPEDLGFTPKEFFIAEVVDERPNRSAVAFLVLPPSAASAQTNLLPVDLKGGGSAAIQQFMLKSLRQDPALRPVVVRVKQYKVTETPGAHNQVDGHVEVALVFDLVKEGKPVFMVEYRGGARYSRPLGQLAVVEPTLRLALADGLRYLNTWMDDVAGTSEFLARGVKVNFMDHTENVADDTVFYRSDRPLKWADFQARPRPGKYGATVFTSFSYEGGREVTGGYVQLNLKLKVYMLKTSSYVKESSRNAYGLNHEQRHFDIAKMVADRFKRRIQETELTVEDYDSIVQYIYLEFYREMHRLQELYDRETRNGLDTLAQQRWNQRLDAELTGHPIKL